MRVMPSIVWREQVLAGALLASLLLHVIALVWFRGDREDAESQRRPGVEGRLSVRIDRGPAAAASARPGAAPGAHALPPRAALRPRARAKAGALAPTRPAKARAGRSDRAGTGAGLAATTGSAAHGASAPTSPIPLSPLDDEVMKQVARHYARPRHPTLPASTPHDRLGEAIQRAARPDCLRSPAGGHLPLGGLLALPGLLYDAATGNCGI